MKKLISFFLLVLLLSAQSVFSFQLVIPPEGGQGETLTVLIIDYKPGDEVSVSLGRGHDVYSRSIAFKTEVSGAERRVALLGIPSTLSSGKYKVTASNGDEVIDSPFIVKKKEFIEEQIALSRSMSTLRQSDDNRKAVQWRNLYAILKNVNIDDVFENDRLIIPVPPLRRTSFFGDRRTFDYDDGTSAQAIHNGVDYSAETGTPIHAAGRGKVVFAGDRILSGLTVVVEHLPGVYSLYFHMDSIDTEEGDMVESGDLIGTVGATGLVTGAHLHWEVRVAGVAVDPEALVSGSIIDKDFILSSIE
jgi:murein DD-endopeptidase MepM/ murein hydrolase activator NlpD